MLRSVLSPRGFLTWGGLVMLALAAVGFLGVLAQASTPAFWLDDGENIAHTLLGVAALAVVLVPGVRSAVAPSYPRIVVVAGIASIFLAVYGAYVGGDTSGRNILGVANIESPAEVILHLALGAWALAAAWLPETVSGSTGSADRA